MEALEEKNEIVESLSKEEIIEQTKLAIADLEKVIETEQIAIDRLEEFLGKIKFYQGNEQLIIQRTILVNLHSIKTDTLYSSKVSEYKDLLESDLKMKKAKIDKQSKMIDGLKEELIKHNSA